MISCCLIVKNEIDVLEKCIVSVKQKLNGIVNDIVVVDTGSVDGTRELAIQLGCRVFDFEWVNDFSKARNYSLNQAENNWVIVLDADEFIVECDIDNIKKFLVSKNEKVIGEIDIHNYGDLKGLSYNTAVIPRVFNRNEVEYKGIIHETPTMKNCKEVQLEKLKIEIHHTGYIDSVAEEKNKADRNIELLNKALEKEDDMYLTMHLAKSYIRKGDYLLALDNLEKIIFNEELVKYEYYGDSVSEYVRCLINAKQYAAGLVCENFWERCYNDSTYVYYMGHIYFRNKYYEKAVDCFLDILSRDETKISKVMALYSLGQLFATIEMYEESLMYFNMCGDYSKAAQNIAEINKILGK